MKMEEFIKQWDKVVSEKSIADAKDWIKNAISAAIVENDDVALLTMYNEAMGFCRESGDVQGSFDYADKAIAKAQEMNLTSHPAYATTLQNVANAYRAGGRLEDSLECYKKVMECYKNTLDESDMLYASMYNNMSLLEQEAGDFAKAKKYLLRALDIVNANENNLFEEAVTYANLSSTCAVLGENKEAMEYGQRAITLFREGKIKDAHYAAALNGVGSCYYKTGDYEQAVKYMEEAAACIKSTFGETESYNRVKANIKAAKEAMGQIKGIDLCRAYYDTYGVPMLSEKFAAYENRITVGLCGEGSDCSGFDDAISRDHDWGPGFSLWVDKDTYDEIGNELVQAYDALPKEFRGFTRKETIHAKGRVGVCISEEFYERVLGYDWAKGWEKIPEDVLFAAVSGEIFHSADTEFERIRNMIINEYPLYMKLSNTAQNSALFSQGAQYNYPRLLRRGDLVGARLSLVSGIAAGMKLIYELEGQYPPCDKWLYAGLASLPDTDEERMLIWKILGSEVRQEADEMLLAVERLATLIAQRMYSKALISDEDPYLESHTDEISSLMTFARMGHEQLVEEIVKSEFKAFDKVKNEGGRASCQDDFETFRIMRISQYDIWTDEMLTRYLYDFRMMMAMGRNPIEEKYARMMESTDINRYKELEKNLPIMTDEQRTLIDAICAIQVEMMEEFASKNPNIADRARSIHTLEDTMYNTSYETYLRGEIATYSSNMLIMYGKFVVAAKKAGVNLAQEIMSKTVNLYGYDSVSDVK